MRLKNYLKNEGLHVGERMQRILFYALFQLVILKYLG